MSLAISKDFTLDASADRVWDVMTTEFAGVANWAAGIAASTPNPKYTDIDAGVPGGRICEVPGFGTVDEQIVTYEPTGHTLAYTAEADKMPNFVQNLTIRWQLTPGGNSTNVSIKMSADLNGPIGAIMKPMMRRRFDKQLTQVAGDLKTYVVTGRVSDAKSKELAKRAEHAA